MVMVGDSSPRGCEFEPQCPIDYVKNVLVFDKICKKTPGWTAYIKKLSPQESSNKNQMVTTRAPKLSNIKNGKQAKGKKEGGCNCNIL